MAQFPVTVLPAPSAEPPRPQHPLIRRSTTASPSPEQSPSPDTTPEASPLPPGHNVERSICDLTVWDPSEAECESFVASYTCTDTYGTLCPDQTVALPEGADGYPGLVPVEATLSQGCQLACGVSPEPPVPLRQQGGRVVPHEDEGPRVLLSECS